MTSSATNPGLAPFYRFFETHGMERLSGLGQFHFNGLSECETEEAWEFLKDGFNLSTERIVGLYIMNALRAVALFKEEIRRPMNQSPFPAEQEAHESHRLLMLKYIVSVEPIEEYLVAIAKFADSRFPTIRTQFAQSLPARHACACAIDALKKMIYTETERIPLASAITKFMANHGMEYDMNNRLYKSTYLLLRSGIAEDKAVGMNRVEGKQLSVG